MTKEVQMSIKMESELRDEFMAIATEAILMIGLFIAISQKLKKR